MTFGAAPTAGTKNGGTFDNSAGLNNATISTPSVVGVNGAFTSATRSEFGSPGTIAPVPLPAAAWLLVSGLGLVPAVARLRKQG